MFCDSKWMLDYWIINLKNLLHKNVSMWILLVPSIQVNCDKRKFQRLWFLRWGSIFLIQKSKKWLFFIGRLVKGTQKRQWKYDFKACAFKDFQPASYIQTTFSLELGYVTLNVGGATRQVLSMGPGLMGKRRIGLGECDGLGVRLQHTQHNSTNLLQGLTITMPNTFWQTSKPTQNLLKTDKSF